MRDTGVHGSNQMVAPISPPTDAVLIRISGRGQINDDEFVETVASLSNEMSCQGRVFVFHSF